MYQVSIIIPCFDAADTLQSTIESVIDNNRAFNIIVVDDGSGDNTLAIARKFEPGIAVLTGPNRGVSHARNRGISESTSEWIIFLDADDLLTPSTIQHRLAVAERTGADVIICDWIDFEDEPPVSSAAPATTRRIDWPSLYLDAELATATSVWATTASIMYRRTLVEKIGGFREDLPVIQDARFLFDAARTGARFAHAPHVGAYYRIAPNSLSRRNPGRFWIDVLRNAHQIEALWRSDGVLSYARLKGLHCIYNSAVRGLFSARRLEFFDAIAALTDLNLKIPLHARIAAPLARSIGLNAAQRLFSIIGRG